MVLIAAPETPDRLEIDPDEINRLAGSIKELGQLTPIEVVKNGEFYEIVFGHRRYLAHKVLGKKTIIAIVKVLEPEDIKKRRATENLGRVNLSAVEEGAVYLDLRNEYHMTKNQIAEFTGKSASRVKRCQDIHKMPMKMQRAIHKKSISIGVGESLMGCQDKAHQDYLLDMSIEHGVTVAVVRQWVDDWRKEQRTPSRDIDPGGGDSHLMETPPSYMACNTCSGPTDITKVKYLQICPSCHETILNAMREKPKQS
jgi:ParB/RepB/Spo0J family partition protein